MKLFKKSLAVILALITVFSLGVCAYGIETKLALVSDGSADASIVISAEAADYEKYSAETLQKYICEMTGAKPKIITDDVKLGGNKIFVGETVYTDFDFAGMKDGSYFITSDKDSVTICGSGNSGTVYGVYRFLEEYCSLHFYTKDVVTIDHCDTLTVPDDINISYEPYFSARRLDTTSTYNTDFAVANSLNNGMAIPVSRGGSIPYLGNFCHSLINTYCTPGKYFDEHPEYFALHDGKRVPDQLCLTNDDVLKIVTEEVLQVLRQQSDPNADLQILSVTQNDNQNFCTCDKCAALDKENGSHAGTMITFANKIADTIKAAGYDNVWIDTFAYQYTRQAPTKVVPADNVVVRLCSIECCFGHTLEDPNCKENAAFMKDLEAWSKICDKIYIWDYVNNYSETICPFANFGVLQKNLQTFYEHNVIGVYEEGNYYQSSCDGEFADLRTYMLSQFMENPYCDYDDVVNRFLEAFYGDGWKNIREFIDILTEHSVTKNKHLYIRQQPRDSLPKLSAKEITRCDELWENAKAMAKDETQLARVERSELCWLYWKCTNYKKEFSVFHSPYMFMNVRENLFNKLLDMGFTMVGEGAIKVLSYVPVFHLILPCDYWEAKHENGFWTFVSPIVEWFYKVFTDIHFMFVK